MSKYKRVGYFIFPAVLVGAIVAISYYLLNSNRIDHSTGEPAEQFQVSGPSEVAAIIKDYTQRHNGVLARAISVSQELKRGRDNEMPFPERRPELVLNVGIRALHIKLRKLAHSLAVAGTDENFQIDQKDELYDSTFVDLFDAYIFYVAGVHSLQLRARKMKTKINQDALEMMKVIAALNVSRRYGQALRGGWLMDDGEQQAPEPGTKVAELVKFRNWIVYDWSSDLNQEQRLKIASGTVLYFDKIFPEDSIQWASRFSTEGLPQIQSRAIAKAGAGNPQDLILITSLEALFE